MDEVKKLSLSDEICQALKEDIYSGVLPAGAAIDAQSLMDRFAVSRTPVREAIQALVSLGYLVLAPRHGAVVKSLTAAEYIAMLEVLIQLESLAASLSARRMPVSLRSQMNTALETCRTALERADHQAYEQANRRFHETIYAGCLNPYLAEQVRDLRIRMRHPRKDTFEIPSMMKHSLLGHEAIYEAIMAGDEQASADAMTAHIGSGGNVYSDAIARLS